MRAEVDHAAALGVELFVLDAGWYAGGTSTADFDTGLGTWKADCKTFSHLASGRSATTCASRGMKFGIWIEPERVDTRLLVARGHGERAGPRDHGRTLQRRHEERVGHGGPGLPRRHRRSPVGPRSGHPPDRRGQARLPEVGQQLLDQLRSHGTRARIHRRQLLRTSRALRRPGATARAVSRPHHRELRGWRATSRPRHAALHRRGLDGRHDRALGPRAP